MCRCRFRDMLCSNRRKGHRSFWKKPKNEVSKPLFIPLYGKSQVSKNGIILNDSVAEKTRMLSFSDSRQIEIQMVVLQHGHLGKDV